MSQSAILSSPSEQPAIRGWGETLTRMNVLLSLRGMLLLLFAFVLFLGPISRDHDIIAAVIAGALIGVVFLFATLTLLQTALVRNVVDIRIFPPRTLGSSSPTGGERSYAQGPVHLMVRCSPVSVLPCVQLALQLEFAHESIPTSIHRIVGVTRGDRILHEEIVFPHRGEWRISQIQFQCGDLLGLSQMKWESAPSTDHARVTIHPPPWQRALPPVMSSRHRAGDMHQDLRERVGDPFDLRRYHAADGMRRVVWKIFARTGELISRYPEQTMTPEGQTIVYCFARTIDDDACAATIAYLQQLESLELAIRCGCSGSDSHALATTSEEALQAMIDAAWHESRTDMLATHRTNLQQFAEFVSLCQRENSDNAAITRLIMFCSSDAVQDDDFAELIEQAGNFLSSQQITPTFVVTPSSQLPIYEASSPKGWRRTVKSWFVSGSDVKGRGQAANLPQFLARCSDQGWEIYS